MKKYWEYLVLVWFALVPWGTVLIWRDTPIEYNKLVLYGSELLFWAIFIWGLVARYVSKPKFDWHFYLLAAWLIIGALFAFDSALAWQSIRWVAMAAAVIWFLQKKSLPQSKVLFAVSLGFLPVIILGIAQFFLQQTWGSVWFGLPLHQSWEPGASVVVGEFGRWLRAYGSFPHPNIFGGYLVLALLISATGIKTNQWCWFYIMMAGLSSACLIFTFSRSAWLGLIVALVFGWKWFKDEQLRLWFGVISLTIAITAWLLWPLIIGRTQIIGVQEQRSVSERVSGWHEAIAVWQTHPVRGVGLGNYTSALQQRFPGSSSWTYQPVHNLGLLLLAEVGVAGLGIFIIIFWSPFKKHFWQLWWFTPIMIIGLFDHYFLTLYPGWLLLGLWVGLWPKSVHS